MNADDVELRSEPPLQESLMSSDSLWTKEQAGGGTSELLVFDEE